MTLTLLALPGDGIGPEITAAAVAVTRAALARTGVAVRIDEAAIGFAALDRHGTTLPEPVLAAARAADGIILGPVSHNDYPPVAEGGINPSGALRRALDLYANIRPARTRPGVPTKVTTRFDLVIVRENLEGFYADRNLHQGPGEFMPVPGVALAIRRVTSAASRRIAERAFALAAARSGQRVTAVHKANVLRVSDGVFLEEVRAVAARHPGIGYTEMLVDAAAAHLIRDPAQFDVVVTTNMFGDILSDQASEMAGGLGLAASLNAGDDHGVAQAQHGSAPDLAGTGRANPSSLIGSAAMLLSWLGQRGGDGRLVAAGRAIEQALDTVLAKPVTRTADLGGALGTAAFTDRVMGALQGGQA